jgi:hypothetical protein
VTRDIDDPMEAEFDTVAEWTARVAADLGPEYYIAAACRGSGQPAILDWLLERLGPRPGQLMIDVGAGLGGPAAYACCTTCSAGPDWRRWLLRSGQLTSQVILLRVHRADG